MQRPGELAGVVEVERVDFDSAAEGDWRWLGRS